MRSIDDLMEDQLTEAAVQEAIKMISPWVQANRGRLLSSLSKNELTSLAQAMIARWIAERSKLESEMPNDPIDDLWR